MSATCVQERRSRGQVTAGRSWPRRAGALFALALALAALAGAAPAAAGTPYVDGISDQNLGLWNGDYQDSSGLFGPLFDNFFATAWVGVPGAGHLQYARFVTAPDAIAQGGACEQNLTNWYTYVTQTLHLIPVIAVWDVAEGGCANHGQPSPAAYTADITALLNYLDGLYPGTNVQYVEAWNEPNSSNVAPATAAAYWSAANGVCASVGCTAIAGDFVDNDPDQSSPSFQPGCPSTLTWNVHLVPYEKAYVAALAGATPTIWGFHPYFAVNCEQSGSVSAFESALPTPAAANQQIWFTEVAAWECLNGQTPPRGVTQQNADAQYLVNTLMSGSDPNAPAHVFYYEMAAPSYELSCSKYADSELYEATSVPGYLYARPAAATIFGPDTTLAAAAAPPSNVTATQATFNGTVTPGGIYEASYFFQYGPTSAYGAATPAVALGPGLEPAPVSATVQGLTPGSAYHYRLVVTDTATPSVTVDGADTVMEPVLLAASTASVTAGAPVTVSWSGLSNPSGGDWVGLYKPGAPAGAALDYFYAGSCTRAAGASPPASGSCTYTTPPLAGIYELRLYAGPAGGLLTSSSPLTVVPPAPVASAAPSIAGASGDGGAWPGDTLSCSGGGWSNEPTAFAYEWSSDGSALPGASSQTYVVSALEVGHLLACRVTASNAGGAGPPAASSELAVVSPQPVAGAPPGGANVAGPSIRGAAVSGARLRESHASWSNSPTSFRYQWQRCDRAGAHCRAIAGARGRSYTLGLADVGFTIRVAETASNARAVGAPAFSPVTRVVEPPPPNTLLGAATFARANTTVTFRFRATGSSTHFQCSLVAQPARRGTAVPPTRYTACRSPVTFADLAPARYVLYVRAVGPGGPDATPASDAFVVR